MEWRAPLRGGLRLLRGPLGHARRHGLGLSLGLAWAKHVGAAGAEVAAREAALAWGALELLSLEHARHGAAVLASALGPLGTLWQLSRGTRGREALLHRPGASPLPWLVAVVIFTAVHCPDGTAVIHHEVLTFGVAFGA